MRTRQEVIENMLFEIEEFCERHDIEYFLYSKVMRYAIRDEHLGENIITADLMMTPENFDRFVKAFEADPVADREIEYMGNSEKFPGLFLRYVDATTIHYNTIRLSCERCMGMYITINVLRPRLGKVKQKLCSTWEKVWKNKVYYDIPYNRRLGRMLYKRLNRQIAKKGQAQAARDLYEMLIKEYSKGDTRKKCWIMQPNSLNVENFGNSQFATVVKVPYLGKLVSAPLYYTKNRINAGRRSRKLAPYVNNKTSFCDTEISYKEFDLSKYRESAIRYRKKIRDLNMALRPYKRKRIKLFKKLVITYLRYNFGLRILDRMDEIEALYQAKDYDALDEIIGSYVKYLRKYKNVYLSERLNEIIYDVYNFKPDQLYDDVPEVYKEGIKIYDNDGKYVRTLGE